MRRAWFLLFTLFLVPSLASAGTQTYSTSGAHTFTVPSYGTLTVQVWGAGGGGGGVISASGTSGTGQSGVAGGQSSFNGSVIGSGGGGGGPGGQYYRGCCWTSTPGGTGGSASGGTTNTSGNSGALHPIPGWWSTGTVGGSGASGGAGGAGGPTINTSGSAGTAPGGGGGGSGGASGSQQHFSGGSGGGGGGYSSRTYVTGAFASGASIPIVVGTGGTGGGVSPRIGGAGAPGRVTISWTDAPACSVTATTNPLDYGDSTTLEWSSSNSDTFYINNVGYVTPNTSGSATVGPLETTAYDGTATGANGTATCDYTLTVNPPPTCSWSGGTVPNNSSVTAYQTDDPSYGTSCASISETRTCTNGTLSGSYAYAACTEAPTCTQSWACTGTGNQTITQTNVDCSTSTLDTCVAPQFCSAGQSVCFNPNPSFEATGGTNLTGHLQAVPRIIQPGASAKLFWNVDNVLSCTVNGNGDSWSGTSSGASGRTSSPILQQATYTLRCLTLPDGSDFFTETQTINLIPGFREL